MRLRGSFARHADAVYGACDLRARGHNSGSVCGGRSRQGVLPPCERGHSENIVCDAGQVAAHTRVVWVLCAETGHGARGAAGGERGAARDARGRYTAAEHGLARSADCQARPRGQEYARSMAVQNDVEDGIDKIDELRECEEHLSRVSDETSLTSFSAARS